MIFSETEYGALLSACQLYRYRLWRVWNKDLPLLCFLMLNPSTADAKENDNSIRVCMQRARMLLCGGIVVVNLFCLRTVSPKIMLRCDEPIESPHTKGRALLEVKLAIAQSRMTICAWGANGSHMNRACQVLEALRPESRAKLHYLRLTKSGQPEHPLYIPYSEQPKFYGADKWHKDPRRARATTT